MEGRWRVGARRRGFLPRSRVWKGAFRYTIDLTCLASPCRAGDSRSRPPAAKRGRGTRQPLPDGAGPAPWRQAGHDVGDNHIPSPRFLPKFHSMPPASRTVPVICGPMRYLAVNFLKKNTFSRASSNTRRPEFGRCGKSGFRQAPKCCFASHRAFEDFAGDLPTNVMLLGPGREDFTGSFEGDFHIG